MAHTIANILPTFNPRNFLQEMQTFLQRSKTTGEAQKNIAKLAEQALDR